MSVQDEIAMVWMKYNLPTEAIIGVNSDYWKTNEFIGTDAGYWILYFAELETSTRNMASGRSSDYYLVRERTKLIVDLYSNSESLSDLCRQGVDYLYSASKPPYNTKDFNIEKLSLQPGTLLVYNQDGVQILDICEGH